MDLLELHLRGSTMELYRSKDFLSNGGRFERFYLILPKLNSTSIFVDGNGPFTQLVSLDCTFRHFNEPLLVLKFFDLNFPFKLVMNIVGWMMDDPSLPCSCSAAINKKQ